ncbi:MAG: hypothetical protein PHD31_02325 [Candidatus Pacebacteria bacterium]|nr:hypothetical protein [Candidatus Paceibacterota bacterium]
MKSNHCFHILAILGIISCLLIAGCTQSQDTSLAKTSSTQTQSPSIRQSAMDFDNADLYFPMKVGSEWLYRIDVKENGAIIHKETSAFNRREMIYPQNKGNRLRIRIAKTVDKQCDTQYPDSLQLQIIEDDFKIFKYDQEIFWIKLGLSSSGTYMVNQVTTLKEASDESCAEKVLFIADRVNTGMSRSGSKDEVIYLGKEQINYEQQTIECMHFRRTVGSIDGSSVYWRKGFTEDSWYASDKGLIRMEQKVDDKISMVWNLENFKSG